MRDVRFEGCDNLPGRVFPDAERLDAELLYFLEGSNLADGGIGAGTAQCLALS